MNNRRREPWVLEGLGNLHHPLRAEASAKYVQPSLELLREIQQTGDIFFPDALDEHDALGPQFAGGGRRRCSEFLDSAAARLIRCV